MARLVLSGLFLLFHTTCPSIFAQDLGPYKEIYPFTNISRDQQSCSPDPDRNVTCPLYIAMLQSFGGGLVSSGVIPGVQLALNQINEDKSILPGYTLHYTLTDTQCDRTTALSALHTELLQPPTKIDIIGSGCSVATEPTAEVSRFYNLTHISCVSSSIELTNRTRYVYHFGLLAVEANLAVGFYSIIRHFNWTRVTLLVQEENIFTVTMARLATLLKSDGVEVRERMFKSAIGIKDLNDPFDDNYRIYVASMYSNQAKRLLCKAYEQQIFYPRYIFLLYGWYEDQWWLEQENENLPCTAEQREMVLSYSLAVVQDESISDCSRTAKTGINGYDFYREIQALFENSEVDYGTLSTYAQQCYDATWSLALSLNNTFNSIQSDATLQQQLSVFNDGMNFTGLQHFTYNNSGFVDILRDHISNTNINGISGNVRVNTSSGLRLITRILVRQHRPSKLVDCTTCDCENKTSKNLTMRRDKIGTIDIRSPEFFNLILSEDQLWINGVPFDGRPIEELHSVHPSITGIFVILSTAGIVFAIVCMVFNYVFRRKKLIRLSSPNLNYLIGAGAIVLYVDTYFFVIPTTSQITTTAFCTFTVWLTAIGYSLCYGTIVVKMFRVFYIFKNPTAKKQKLQDWHLSLIVLMFVAIDVLILVAYVTYSSIQNTLWAVRQKDIENPRIEINVRGIIIEYFFYSCDSQSRDICLGILFSYKAVLQIVALIFSFSIRKVKVKGLNDAKEIAAAVYVTSIVTAVIIVSFYSLKGYLNLYAVLFSLGFLIGTTAILCLIFISKMYYLYQDPQGKNVHFGAHSSSAEQRHETQADTNDAVEMLRNQVRDLQAALSSLRLDSQLSTFNEGRPAARQQQLLNTDATLTTPAEE